LLGPSYQRALSKLPPHSATQFAIQRIFFFGSERSANSGLFYLSKVSDWAVFEFLRRKLPKVSSRIQ
jgi:hypothetical protein